MIKFSDLLVSNASNIYLKTASKTLFYKEKHVPGRKVKKVRPRKPWMSSNCLLLRSEVRSLGKKLQKDPKNVWIKQTFSNCVKEHNKLRTHLKKSFL